MVSKSDFFFLRFNSKQSKREKTVLIKRDRGYDGWRGGGGCGVQWPIWPCPLHPSAVPSRTSRKCSLIVCITIWCVIVFDMSSQTFNLAQSQARFCYTMWQWSSARVTFNSIRSLLCFLILHIPCCFALNAQAQLALTKRWDWKMTGGRRTSGGEIRHYHQEMRFVFIKVEFLSYYSVDRPSPDDIWWHWRICKSF